MLIVTAYLFYWPLCGSARRVVLLCYVYVPAWLCVPCVCCAPPYVYKLYTISHFIKVQISFHSSFLQSQIVPKWPTDNRLWQYLANVSVSSGGSGYLNSNVLSLYQRIVKGSMQTGNRCGDTESWPNTTSDVGVRYVPTEEQTHSTLRVLVHLRVARRVSEGIDVLYTDIYQIFDSTRYSKTFIFHWKFHEYSRPSSN